MYGKVTNAEIFHYIKDNLDWDQMIWEFGTDENPNWVHVSYKRGGGNRRQLRKAFKDEKGRTAYTIWQSK